LHRITENHKKRQLKLQERQHNNEIIVEGITEITRNSKE